MFLSEISYVNKPILSHSLSHALSRATDCHSLDIFTREKKRCDSMACICQ